jgi:FtsH-binding integral membrane protein
MYSETSERSFLSRVFMNMTWALAITALTAFGVASYPPFINAIINNIGGLYILLLLEVLLVWYLSRRIAVMSTGAAYFGFIVYSLVNGVTLSLIFIIYELSSIFMVFFITAGLFLVMSMFGYFTKADLSPLGRFFIMALFGLIIATVVNLFMRSEMLDYVLSFAGILIFSGLTAYDVQKLKVMYQNSQMEPELLHKASIIGALQLYLDFINLFLRLLRIFGRRR